MLNALLLEQAGQVSAWDPQEFGCFGLTPIGATHGFFKNA
jgi:hypothetical protein